MPVFIILLFLGAGLLWLLCSFCFIPLGRIAYRLLKDAYNAMTEQDQSKKSEIEEK